ncbi:hypothetical protein C8R46DRAFT_1229987 [Mycena filopes]|nr:hypothetical protein C8R46DRAFT_1229987 [Mycena filopes]
MCLDRDRDQTVLTDHMFTKRRRGRDRFTGEREAFLKSALPTYLDSSKAGKLPSFWPTFFAAYWTKFPWRLANHVEPYVGMPENNEGGLSLSDEEKRQAMLSNTQCRIKAWFNMQRLLRARTRTA